MASRLTGFFALLLGSALISIILYAPYQKNYLRLLPQNSYDNTRTGSKNDNPNYCRNKLSQEGIPSQYGNSIITPASGKRPRPLVVPVSTDKEECLPFFKDLRVKAVPEEDCEQPHVLMTQGGRLGNKLCQYASVYLLRYLYGVRVSIPKKMHDYLNTIFKNITLPAQNTCFTNQTEKVKFVTVYMKLYTAAAQARARAVDNNIKEQLLNASYYVRNNPGPRSLLMAHRDLIRSLLTFRDEIVNKAIENIDQALSSFNATYHQRNFPVVTVHVRRTDYTGYIDRKFNLTQLDELYFERAFEFYKERLPRPVFLVLSDDREWCRRKLQAKDVIVIAKASATVDMAVMSLGDHHITSYGTYSFSGALLGHGHITHPIGHNTKYNLADCVDSHFFHHISRDKTYIADNSEVVVSWRL